MNHAANGERLHKVTPKRAQRRGGEVYEVDTTILPGISVRGRFSGDGLCGVGAVAVWRGIGRGKHRRGVVGQRFFWFGGHNADVGGPVLGHIGHCRKLVNV